MTGNYDARSVANLLLDIADERRASLTQISLLKIIYFAHGWYLAAFDKALVVQNFEAWEYGPVIKVVRDEFKEFKGNIINKRAYKFDIISGKLSLPDRIIDDTDIKFIDNIFSEYHHFGAWKLSDMTHEKGSPWDQLWNASNPTGRLGLRLRNSEIKQHFERLSTENAVS